jgi:hypothetical protein
MKKSDKVLFDKLCKLFFIIITCYSLYYFFFKRKPLHEGLSDHEKQNIYLTNYATYKDTVPDNCLYYNETYKGTPTATSSGTGAPDSWEKCAKKCKDTSLCNGFTYERSAKKCDIFNDITKGTVYKYSPKYTYTEHKSKTCRDSGFPSADHLTEAVCTLANGLCDKDKLGWTPQKKAGKEFGYPADGAAAAAGVGGDPSSACPYLPYIPNEYTKHAGYTGNTTGTQPYNVCSGDTCPGKLGWTPKKNDAGIEHAGLHCPYFPAGDDTDAKRDLTIKLAQKYCDSDTECTGITEYSGGTYANKQQICFRKGTLSTISQKITGTNIYIKGEPSDANIQPYIGRAKQACSNIPECKGIYVAKKGGFICFNKTVYETRGTNARMNCHIKSSTVNPKYGIVSGEIANCYDKYPPTETNSPCTCSNGTPETGAKCTPKGAAICSTCANDYTLSDKKCVPVAGKKPCTCTNGTAATGAECTSDNGHICKTCNAKYKMDTSSKRCVTDTPSPPPTAGGGKTCTCSNGTAATGTDCTPPGTEICSDCNDGYDLGYQKGTGFGNGKDSDKCVKLCKCGGGYPAKGSECPKKGQQKCVKNSNTERKCKKGFTLDGEECNKCNIIDLLNPFIDCG